MLNEARIKNSAINYKLGTAENTNLKPQSIDGITATLTIHHWTDLNKAFSELFRVLKPNGSLVIFTSTPKQMKGYWLNHYFPKMLEDSIIQMPSFERVKKELEYARFGILKTEKYFIQSDLEDKFLYCGKQNPELYFDENIRNGISSFSDLANKKEIQHGLISLKTDIENGHINNIMTSYQNNLGDYLFIKASKKVIA